MASNLLAMASNLPLRDPLICSGQDSMAPKCANPLNFSGTLIRNEFSQTNSDIKIDILSSRCYCKTLIFHWLQKHTTSRSLRRLLRLYGRLYGRTRVTKRGMALAAAVAPLTCGAEATLLLLGTKGIATISKDTTRGSWPYY